MARARRTDADRRRPWMNAGSDAENAVRKRSPGPTEPSIDMAPRAPSRSNALPQAGSRQRICRSLVLRWDEHVTDAPDGTDRRRVLGVDLDLAADAVDAQVDGPVERRHLAMANALQ